MPPAWPALSYEQWSETCDTLHAHTQVLGKLAVALAPPEPQLQHAALRLTARGWETAPLPAPDGSGALVVALDLRTHEAVVEHSDGRRPARRARPRPAGRRGHARAAGRGPRARRRRRDRPDAAGGPLERAARRGRRARELRPRRRSPPTSPPRPARRSCSRRSARPTAAARRRSTRGGARSTSRSACSPGEPADPPSDDFIMRNAMDAQEVAVGWWPGDPRYRQGGVLRLRAPGARGVCGRDARSPRGARWDAALGEYILDWDDVRASPDPHAARARVRALGVRPRLRGVRVGPGARRQRRRQAAAGRVGAPRVDPAVVPRGQSRPGLCLTRAVPTVRRPVQGGFAAGSVGPQELSPKPPSTPPGRTPLGPSNPAWLLGFGPTGPVSSSWPIGRRSRPGRGNVWVSRRLGLDGGLVIWLDWCCRVAIRGCPGLRNIRIGLGSEYLLPAFSAKRVFGEGPGQNCEGEEVARESESDRCEGDRCAPVGCCR